MKTLVVALVVMIMGAPQLARAEEPDRSAIERVEKMNPREKAELKARLERFRRIRRSSG